MPQLTGGLEHTENKKPGLQPAIALLTATEREQQAVYALLKTIRPDDSYMDGDLPLVDLESVYMVVCAQDRMGTLNAAAVVEELIQRYHPILVVSVGVCGAHPGPLWRERNSTGQLLVGTDVLYYERCKERSFRDSWRDVRSFLRRAVMEPDSSGVAAESLRCRLWTRKWKPRLFPSPSLQPDFHAAEAMVNDLAAQMSGISVTDELSKVDGEELQGHLASQWRLEATDDEDLQNRVTEFMDSLRLLLASRPSVRVAQTYACGEKFASSRVMRRLSRMLKRAERLPCRQDDEELQECIQIGELHAFDMESAGVARACAKTQTKYLFVKTASDSGEEDRSNQHHHAGTVIAASAVIKWIGDISSGTSKELTKLHRRVWSPRPAPHYITITEGQDPHRSLLKRFDEDYLRRAVTEIASLAACMLPPTALIISNLSVANRANPDLRTYYDGLIEDFIKETFKKLLEKGCLGENITEVVIRTDAEITTAPSPLEYADGRLILFADPVDGTANLAAGRPEVAISIGIYYNHQPVCGVVAVPYVNLVIYGTANGEGTDEQDGIERDRYLYVNGLQWTPAKSAQEDGEPYSDPRTLPEGEGSPDRPLTISFPGDYKRLLKHDGTLTEEDQCRLRKMGARLINREFSVRTSGAAAYDLVWLALGRLDGRISPYVRDADVAAGAILIRKLGGKVTDLEGQEWKPTGCPSTLVAAITETTHKRIMEQICQPASDTGS